MLGLKLGGHTNTLTESANFNNEVYKRGEIRYEKQNPSALDNNRTDEMEHPSKLLKQIAFKTRSKIEEHILVVMDKSAREEQLSQPLENYKKQFEKALTFRTC